MPNVALIKAGGLPLNVPAGNIIGIHPCRQPPVEAPTAKTILVTTTNKHMVYWLEDITDDVMEAVLLDAGKGRADREKLWAKLSAPEEVPDLEEKPEGWEEGQKAAREAAGITEEPQEEEKPELPPKNEGPFTTYLKFQNIEGFEGVDHYQTNYGEVKKLEKPMLRISCVNAVGTFIEMADLTPENVKLLSDGLKSVETAPTKPTKPMKA